MICILFEFAFCKEMRTNSRSAKPITILCPILFPLILRFSRLLLSLVTNALQDPKKYHQERRLPEKPLNAIRGSNNYLPFSRCSLRSIGAFLSEIGPCSDCGLQCPASHPRVADVWYLSPVSRAFSKARRSDTVRYRGQPARSASTSLTRDSERCGRAIRHCGPFKSLGCYHLLRKGTKEGDRVAYWPSVQGINECPQTFYSVIKRSRSFTSRNCDCGHVT